MQLKRIRCIAEKQVELHLSNEFNQVNFEESNHSQRFGFLFCHTDYVSNLLLHNKEEVSTFEHSNDVSGVARSEDSKTFISFRGSQNRSGRTSTNRSAIKG